MANKATPSGNTKKPGRTLKEKRAEKHAKKEAKAVARRASERLR